jgi:hypothetical protein
MFFGSRSEDRPRRAKRDEADERENLLMYSADAGVPECCSVIKLKKSSKYFTQAMAPPGSASPRSSRVQEIAQFCSCVGIMRFACCFVISRSCRSF